MHKVSLILVGVMVLTFGFIGTLAAQGGEPPRQDAPQANPDTTISYQGQLRKASGVVTGNCDMAFRLYDAASNGAQISSPITTIVPVTNGLFMVGLNFGTSAFNGEARWLEIGVKCASDAVFTTLTPRQSIAPAPYALALPGMRTMQNPFSPNVIGGYAGNVISDTVKGGTIGGGGNSDLINRVTDSYATIGGGAANSASDFASTIGGGGFNTAGGQYSTVSGGDTNTVSDHYSTVGGGYFNTASSTASTVAGGERNTASGADSIIGGGESNTVNSNHSTVGGGEGNTANSDSDYSTISGGYLNTTNGSASTVGGGIMNTANDDRSTVGGGESNAANNDYATVGGGFGNDTNGFFSTIPGGKNALASHYGEMAYASGLFAQIGDAQTSVYVLRAVVPSNQTSRELFLDGSSHRLTITNTRTLAFDILIVARSDNGKSAGWHYQGVIENDGGTTAFIGTPTKTALGEDDPVWDVTLVADNISDSLVIRGYSNSSGDTIRFVATVRTVEVSY